MGELLVYGGIRTSSVAFRKCDLDGANGADYDFPNTVRCFANNGGYLYVGGVTSTIRQYDTGINQIWSRNSGVSAVYGIAADSDGNYYIPASDKVYKYNSSGVELWNQSSSTISAVVISVDSDNNVIVCGSVTSSKSIWKFNSSGILQWDANHEATVNAVAVDDDGNIYIVGNRAGSSPNFYTLRKYNSSGTLQWSKDHGKVLYAICIGQDGYIYVAGADGFISGDDESKYVRQYSADGTLNWSRAYHGTTIFGISVDNDSNVYVGGQSDGTYHLKKYDSSGTLQWSKSHANTVYVVKVWYWPEPIITDVPALSVAISLGTPGQGPAIEVPGLSIPISLGTPTAQDLTSPDIVAIYPPPKIIYRAYLSGSPVYELPLAWIQCRRVYGQSTWLTIGVPNSIAGLETILNNKLNSELIINSGYQSADGTETLGLFLRATFTEYELEQYALNSQFVLTARVINPSYTAITRNLSGITERGIDNNGLHYAQCAVDPLLRPNDTVNDGVNSWLAGNILYRIEANSSTMRVEEID